MLTMAFFIAAVHWSFEADTAGGLPSGWQTIALFNPVVYLVSGFRWSFYEIADVSLSVSIGMTVSFLVVCMILVWWIFRTGYRLKN